MRSLAKLPEPEKLIKNREKWTASYVAACSAQSGNRPSPWRDDAIRAQLEVETSSRCAYCDAHIAHISTSHIEHHRPRAKYPELVVEWANLTIACPRCNGSKGDKFSEEVPFLNPFCDSPRDHLIFVGPLVFPRGSDRGQYTINELKLNDSAVVNARARRIKYMMQLIDSWLKASPVLKDGILREIHQELVEGEYYETTLVLLKAADVPIN
jgi:phage FluMu protein Com